MLEEAEGVFWRGIYLLLLPPLCVCLLCENMFTTTESTVTGKTTLYMNSY